MIYSPDEDWNTGKKTCFLVILYNVHHFFLKLNKKTENMAPENLKFKCDIFSWDKNHVSVGGCILVAWLTWPVSVKSPFRLVRNNANASWRRCANLWAHVNANKIDFEYLIFRDRHEINELISNLYQFWSQMWSRILWIDDFLQS